MRTLTLSTISFIQEINQNNNVGSYFNISSFTSDCFFTYVRYGDEIQDRRWNAEQPSATLDP